MTTVEAKNLSENLDKYLADVIKSNGVIKVKTKDGNAVIMSAEDYSGLIETVYIMGGSLTHSEINESRKEPLNQGNLYNSSEQW